MHDAFTATILTKVLISHVGGGDTSHVGDVVLVPFFELFGLNTVDAHLVDHGGSVTLPADSDTALNRGILEDNGVVVRGVDKGTS